MHPENPVKRNNMIADRARLKKQTRTMPSEAVSSVLPDVVCCARLATPFNISGLCVDTWACMTKKTSEWTLNLPK